MISLSERLPTILVLGTTQTLAWASSYYLPAILGDAIAKDVGISSSWFFAMFSASLLVAAVLGPRIGRTIDMFGGRGVLSASNVLFAAGLALLGLAHSIWLVSLAWLLLGVGMGMGLYDAAFAALGRIYGTAARPSITGITLLAGFASTIGWPLSAWGLAELGWRETCFAWAAGHILIGLPLNFFLLPKAQRVDGDGSTAKPHIPIDRNMCLLAAAFALAWTVTGAMAAHLPRILEAGGATTAQALGAGALIGPAQVLARILRSIRAWAVSPALVGAPCDQHTSARRRGPRRIRRWPPGAGIRRPARLRQRHPDDCSWDGTARNLRPEKLRLSLGPPGSTCEDRAGGRALVIRHPR